MHPFVNGPPKLIRPPPGFSSNVRVSIDETFPSSPIEIAMAKTVGKIPWDHRSQKILSSQKRFPRKEREQDNCKNLDKRRNSKENSRQ
jgi:hypothetical protein